MPPVPANTSSTAPTRRIPKVMVTSFVSDDETAPARGTAESIANSVLDAAAPIALGATGWGAVLAPFAPRIIDFVFAQYDAIRAAKPPTVTHDEIVAELKARALTANVPARLAAAEAAAGVAK